MHSPLTLAHDTKDNIKTQCCDQLEKEERLYTEKFVSLIIIFLVELTKNLHISISNKIFRFLFRQFKVLP